jgi:NADH-quinone oxidoreductase subunit L
VVALGFLLGWLIYGRKTMEHATDEDPLCVALGGLFTFLNRKWYIDELYDATIIRFTATCGVFFRLVDKLVIDGHPARHRLDGLGYFAGLSMDRR